MTHFNDRTFHQLKEGSIKYTPLTPDGLRLACSACIAFILAYETETTPLKVEFEDTETESIVCCPENEEDAVARPFQLYKGAPLLYHSLKAAYESFIPVIYVLIDKAAGGKVQKIIDDLDKEVTRRIENGDTSIHIPSVKLLAYDKEVDEEVTEEACNFELFGQTMGVLSLVHDCLHEHADADAIIIIDSDQVRINPYHLYEVCRSYLENPEVDAVTSWICWLRRTPYLFPRRLFERLGQLDLCAPNPSGDFRPIPQLNIKEVVFGEEKLAANSVKPHKFKDFLADCSLSAREAVQIARQCVVRQHTEGSSALDSANTSNECKGLSESEELLVSIASDVVAYLEAGLSPEEAEQLDRVDKWARRNQAEFPLLNDSKHVGKLAYLDAAATTQRLYQAIQAVIDFDSHENANIYRGAYDLSVQATSSFNAARKTIEDFIGADHHEMIFTMNTTASCSLVAQAWGSRNIHKNDLIIIGIAEHHSNMLPWLMLAQQRGARIEYLPLSQDGRIDMHAFEFLLGQKPKLISVAHVSNVIGLVNPVQKMAERAHAVGARLFVDAAQSLAHVPLNVKELGADFVAFSAHKAYGPMGVGGLWVAPEAFDEMDPITSGGGAISHVSLDSYYLRAGAIQYETGTPPIPQAIGFAAAIDYLNLIGMDAIVEHGQVLTHYLMKDIKNIPDITVWGDHSPSSEGSGLVSFSLAGVAPADVAEVFASLGVAIRAGGHCALPLHASMGLIGTSRISLSIHTTREDIEAALVALVICWKFYRGEK